MKPSPHCLKANLALVLFPLLLTSAAVLNSAEKKWQLPAETAALKTGPGAELVTTTCVLCHSADYVSTQPPMDRAAWQAIVTKMREKFAAPIPEEKIPEILNYLVANYGHGK